jgi:hypothetical protein
MKLLLTFILGAALAWPQIIVLPKKKAAASGTVEYSASPTMLETGNTNPVTPSIT